MRVAALADIHGNLPALEAVLAEVERKGVDAVVVCGDVVGGPFSAEVLDRLTALPDVRFVHGNADRFVLDGVDEYGQDWDAERALLGEGRLAEVASWPLTVELEIEGLGRTLFCHAVPSADEPIITRITPDQEVVEAIGDLDAGLVICGHTHMQFDRLLPSGMRVVNAGSVGRPYEGRRGAFWALLGPDVELRSTDYDVEAAVDLLRRAPSPADDALVESMLDPPDPDETSAFFESQRGA